MSTKIAPTVEAWTGRCTSRKNRSIAECDPEEHQRVYDEWRAVLAVIRAARRVEKNRPANCWQDEATALRRALDRLDAVSGRRPPGTRGVEGNRKLSANSRRGRAAGRTTK